MEQKLVDQVPLPIAGIGGGMRNAFSIMMMLPHVKSGNGESAWDDFQVGGCQQHDWSVSVDGLLVEMGWRNHVGYMNRLTPPVGSVQEFRIETATFKAEDSRASGGNIAVTQRPYGLAFRRGLTDFFKQASPPLTKLADRFPERPNHPWRATLPASAPTGGGSLDICQQFRHSSLWRRGRAWRRFSDHDCKQLGTNPFPHSIRCICSLTRCLSFGRLLQGWPKPLLLTTTSIDENEPCSLLLVAGAFHQWILFIPNATKSEWDS